MYDFILNISESDSLSQLSGKHIPVDKVKNGIYKPSESLYEIIEEIDRQENSDRSQNYKRLIESIKLGYVTYNLNQNKWSIEDRTGFWIVHTGRFIFLLISGPMLSFLSYILIILLNPAFFYSLNAFFYIIMFSIISISCIWGIDSTIQKIIEYSYKRKAPI